MPNSSKFFKTDVLLMARKIHQSLKEGEKVHSISHEFDSKFAPSLNYPNQNTPFTIPVIYSPLLKIKNNFTYINPQQNTR